MEDLKVSNDTLFILLGAIMVLAMHAGFAFLELGTVRKKNQVNALVKILTDFAMSTLAYFFIGYVIAYGTNFLAGADVNGGTVVGSSGRYGAVPEDRPVTPQEFCASIYRGLGIDVYRALLPGPKGVPVRLVEADPVTELFV